MVAIKPERWAQSRVPGWELGRGGGDRGGGFI